MKLRFFALATLLFAAIFAFGGKAAAQSKNEILIVADQKASCRGIVAEDCLQVKHLNEDKYTPLRQEIENFKFIPGYFYILKVRAETIKNSPADNSSVKYQLRKILAREKSGGATIPASGAASFSETQWKLTLIENQPVGDSKAFIKFDEQNRRAGGNGGCNGYGGTLTRNGNQIKISQIISTKMACQNGSDVENKFFRNLDRVDRFEIVGDRLRLLAGNQAVLEFEAEK